MTVKNTFKHERVDLLANVLLRELLLLRHVDEHVEEAGATAFKIRQIDLAARAVTADWSHLHSCAHLHA